MQITKDCFEKSDKYGYYIAIDFKIRKYMYSIILGSGMYIYIYIYTYMGEDVVPFGYGPLS